MKLPRDLDARTLIKALENLGYKATRQTGSHIRLTREGEPSHHLTIPLHSPLKIGTLNAICHDLAHHHGRTKDQLLAELKLK